MTGSPGTKARYGVVFDVDGVIADTEPVNARASITALEEVCGITGVQAKDFAAGVGRGAEEYVKAAARMHNISMTGEEVTCAVNRRQENFLRVLEEEGVPLFPGVLELMRAALAKEDVAVAIATSSTREKSGAVLKATGVPVGQVAWVTGDDVQRKKPDPELFLAAAGRIGVAPERCVVFEDAPDGVEAARAAGAKSIAVTNTAAASALSRATRVVASLAMLDLETVCELIDNDLVAD